MVWVLVALLEEIDGKLQATIPDNETIIEQEVETSCTICNSDYWLCLIDKKATSPLKVTVLNRQSLIIASKAEMLRKSSL